MYRDKFIYGLMAASALFAACSDDFEVAGGPKNPVSEGDEILFGAKNLATFKDGFTDDAEKGGRTVYGDAEYVQNADGTGYWKYPLSWIYGDSISIYSPQATFPNDGGKGYANYEVQWEGGAPGDTATSNNLAYLVKMDANGLHWGDLDEPHTFYAFYPKSFIDKDESFGTDPKNTSIVKGEIPKYQPMMKWVKKTEGAKNHWVGLPDMELCLMHATATVKPNDVAVGIPVQLDFKPLTTAVEVTLIVDDSQSAAADKLQMLHVRGRSKDKSQVQSICGNFSFDLNTGKAVSLDQDITNDYEISVPLWVEGADGPEPLTLNSGDTVTLTVFFLPQDTFEYDCYEQADTISIDGLPASIATVYDMNNEEFMDCSYETDIQYKWLAIKLVDNELILSLAENSMTDMRRMWVWLCNGDYYKRIYIVQNGENIKPVNMRCL